MLGNILIALGIVALIWVLYRSIRNNPGAFTTQNLNKSLMTLGILALMLIGVIAFAIILLR